jgi:hypothetical protein
MRNLLKINVVLFCFIFITSCENEEITKQNEELNLEFEYSLYNSKESLFSTLEKTNLKKYNLKSTGLSEFENAIEIINEEYGTGIYVSDFDQFLIDNPSATIDDMLQGDYITQGQYNIISGFFDDLDKYNFDESIDRLEERVLAMNLTSNEFEKYNYFVNGLMVTNDYYLNQGVNIFSRGNSYEASAARTDASCAVAIASNAISTLGLTSCAVPGPWCAVAVVGKGLSLAGIFLSC